MDEKIVKKIESKIKIIENNLNQNEFMLLKAEEKVNELKKVVSAHIGAIQGLNELINELKSGDELKK